MNEALAEAIAHYHELPGPGSGAGIWLLLFAGVAILFFGAVGLGHVPRWRKSRGRMKATRAVVPATFFLSALLVSGCLFQAVIVRPGALHQAQEAVGAEVKPPEGLATSPDTFDYGGCVLDADLEKREWQVTECQESVVVDDSVVTYSLVVGFGQTRWVEA